MNAPELWSWIEDQPIAVEQRRSGRAVIVADRSEVLVPDDLAVQIERRASALPNDA